MIIKLISQLFTNSSCPTANLVVDKLNMLFSCLNLIQMSLQFFDFFVQFIVLHDIRIVVGMFCILRKTFIILTCSFFIDFFIVVLKQNFLKICSLLFIFLFQNFVLFLVFTYRLQKGRVCLFSSQKFHYHFFDIRIASTCPHFLESLFGLTVMFHFTLHSFFEENGPGHLCIKLVSHFQFILIFAFILCCFSDLILSLLSVVTFLYSFFFVFNRSIK